MTVARFFDTRAAYMMFSTATNEKAVVASRIGEEIDHVTPGERALRLFDAGMGDASVLANLMRRLHRSFPHIPWLVVGKEISIEDVRLALDKLPDRFFEHPEMVFVVTNMRFDEAPALLPTGARASDVVWREVGLGGSTTLEFSQQIHALYPDLVSDWEVRTSPKTGNPLYARPAVLIIYRRDREFVLNQVIPDRDGTDGEYDLVIASQPYRARTSVERKVRTVVEPLVQSLAPGGRLVAVHGHGRDPGLEIIRGVWPEEDPFQEGRRQILDEVRRQLPAGTAAEFSLDAAKDDKAIFRYALHAMPSEIEEHIGTSLIVAAWNAAAYVAQIDEPRLSEAMTSGSYIEATRRVIQRHHGVWFNDEAYVIARHPT